MLVLTLEDVLGEAEGLEGPEGSFVLAQIVEVKCLFFVPSLFSLVSSKARGQSPVSEHTVDFYV